MFKIQPGYRKFTAFVLTLSVFVLLSIVALIKDQSIAAFAVALGTGIMLIASGFYASNAWSKKYNRNGGDDAPGE